MRFTPGLKCILLVGLGMLWLVPARPAFGTDPPKSLKPSDPEAKARARRILRWELVFATNDAKDYLSQLSNLGAFIAVPDTKGKLMLIRDLKERPAKPKYEDIKQLKRVYWVDDRKESAENLAKELNLDVIPSAFIAFFPKVVEDELAAREMEAARKKGINDESGVGHTKFRVTFKDGRHTFKVVELVPATDLKEALKGLGPQK